MLNSVISVEPRWIIKLLRGMMKMMISPESYIVQFEKATYEEMIKERDGRL